MGQIHKTSFVFLHGDISTDEPSNAWVDAFQLAASRCSENLDSAINPRFVSIPWVEPLRASPVGNGGTSPVDTYIRGSEELRLAKAASYFARMADLESYLGRRHKNLGSLLSRVPEEVHNGAAKVALATFFPNADAYLSDEERRKKCLSEVLGRFPTTGEVVLIAHSLGSLLATDLIYVLPRGVKIPLMITLGSPLSTPLFREHLQRASNSFPFERVGGWLNLVGRSDPISGGRGISRDFNEVLDIYVDTGPWSNPSEPHAETRYLSSQVFTDVLSWLAKGALTKARKRSVSQFSSRQVSDSVYEVLLVSQYRLRYEEAMRVGRSRDRYANARQIVDRDALVKLESDKLRDTVEARIGRNNQQLLGGRLDPAGATRWLLALHMTSPNVFPFEVADESASVIALERLSLDVGFTTRRSEVVIRSVEIASKTQRNTNRFAKTVLLSAGAAVVVLAPAIMVAAAPSGLAGGAAIVAGLAASGGPMGMMGGLATLSIVAGSGGAMLRSGLSTGTPAEVEERVIYLHALCLAEYELNEPDPRNQAWFALAEMESQLSSLMGTLEIFSDRRAPNLKATKKKRASVQRAMNQIRQAQSGPRELSRGD